MLRPKVGLRVFDTSVAGEGGMISSSVAQPSVEIDMALERPAFVDLRLGMRTVFFGVHGTGRGSRFGAVLDL